MRMSKIEEDEKKVRRLNLIFEVAQRHSSGETKQNKTEIITQKLMEVIRCDKSVIVKW